MSIEPLTTDTDEWPDHEAASLLPSMPDDEFQALKADIGRHGLRQPVVLSEGKILDGRHRARACRELGIRPTTQEWDGLGTAQDYVASANLHRRHLTSSQRAAIAVKIVDQLKAAAKERQRHHRGTAPGQKAETRSERSPEVSGEAREQAAQMMDTNSRYVSIATRIRAEDPNLYEQVVRGEITIPEADTQLEERPPTVPEPETQDSDQAPRPDGKTTSGADGQTGTGRSRKRSRKTKRETARKDAIRDARQRARDAAKGFLQVLSQLEQHAQDLLVEGSWKGHPLVDPLLKCLSPKKQDEILRGIDQQLHLLEALKVAIGNPWAE